MEAPAHISGLRAGVVELSLSDMRGLAACVSLLLLASSPARAECPAAFTPNDLKVVRPTMPPLPERDRDPFPEADARVTCHIGAGGRLSSCSTDLQDERGVALAAYVTQWRVVLPRRGRCPIHGRQFTTKFKLRNTS